MRNAIYAKLVRLSFGYFDRHQTGQLMSRATVDLQAVRFFLGYGLIFFFQHVFTVVAIGDPPLHRLLEARADRARADADHGGARLRLQPRLAPGAARRAAEDGGRRDGRRGERRRRARREGVRAGAGRAGEVRRAVGGALPPERAGQQAACVLRAGAGLRAAPRAGGRGARRRRDGAVELAHGRRVRRVQPLPGHADLPAADARDVDRRGAARNRVGRADLPGDRRARGHSGPAGRRDASGRPRARTVRPRQLRLRPRASRAVRSRPRARGREDGGADRAHGIGKDIAGLADPAVLRRDGRGS